MADTDEHLAVFALIWLPVMFMVVIVTAVVVSCNARGAFEREAVSHNAAVLIPAHRGQEFKWKDELKNAEVSK